MVIELIGAPGAGKTTLLPTLTAFFQERGCPAYTVVQAARPFAQRTLWGRAVCRLAPHSWQKPLLWQVFYRLSIAYRLKFLAQHPRLMQQVWRSQQGRPAAADAQRRQVWHWFLRLTGYYEFLRSAAHPADVLLLDEGFTHRVVQLHTSSVEAPAEPWIAAYVARLPQPDLLIFVQTPVAVCERRIYERGLWSRASHKSTAEVAQFVAHAHRAVGLAVRQAREAGWAVIEIENGRDGITAVQSSLRHQLTQVVAHG
jgi:thymidylate kinase